MIDEPMGVLDDETRGATDFFLSCSHPSDIICLDRPAAVKLGNLWERRGEDSWVPSDIFFADTIPLKDVILDFSNSAEWDTTEWCRVCVFSTYDYMRYAAASESGEMILSGAIVIHIKHRTRPFDLVVPFGVVAGEDSLDYGDPYIKGSSRDAIERAFANSSREELNDIMSDNLSIWYGVQIALLHPTVRDVFANPQRAVETNTGNGKPRKNKPVRYVKRHILNAEEIENKMYVEHNGHKINRKTLIWYVAGHWRYYKNGKVIFIKGYWKGPLRDTMDPIEPREREIVTDGISVDNSGQPVHN